MLDRAFVGEGLGGDVVGKQTQRVGAASNDRRLQIVVVAVAAETGGALSILQGLHAEALSRAGHDWVFFVSAPGLDDAAHLEVQRLPWIKRSWMHRLLYDQVFLRKRLKKMRPDIVLSLQNVPAPSVRSSRYVTYLHQALPFSDYSPSVFKEPKFWLYGWITRARIQAGLRRRGDVIVQADWMNRAVSHSRNPGLGRVVTIRPSVRVPAADGGVPDRRLPKFFYPAGPMRYKNHDVLCRAVEIVNKRGVGPFEVILTLTPDELARLTRGTPPANVLAVGRLPPRDVWQLYDESVLVFPSVLETVGLPLIEAQGVHAPVIAVDRPYAREALAGYREAVFFDPDSPQELAELLLDSLETQRRGCGCEAEHVLNADLQETWPQLVDFIVDPSAVSQEQVPPMRLRSGG